MVTLTDVKTTAGTVTSGTSRASARIARYVVSAADVEMAEGRNLTFSVSGTGTTIPPNQDVVVRYSTSSGSARANDDYTTQSGTFTVGSGQPAPVPALPDNLNEGEETFTLRLSLARSLSDVLVGTPSVTGTITDGDDDIEASVRAGQTTVTEGSAATFIVSLTGGTSTSNVVVDYTVAGDATVEDGDYTAPSGSSPFAPEQPRVRSRFRRSTTVRSIVAKCSGSRC